MCTLIRYFKSRNWGRRLTIFGNRHLSSKGASKDEKINCTLEKFMSPPEFIIITIL